MKTRTWLLGLSVLLIAGALSGCATCRESPSSASDPLSKLEKDDSAGEGFLGFLEEFTYNWFKGMGEVGR
jgi:hypothetical protein